MSLKEQINTKQLPKHIAIIMDGNGIDRQNNESAHQFGHENGTKSVREAVETSAELGVNNLTLFAFSTENWKRSQSEVNYLMKLLQRAFKEDFEDYNRREYRLLVSGRIQELPGDLPGIVSEAVTKTKNNSKGIFNICLNYGGRAEIVDAIKKIIKNNIEEEQIHEGMIRKYLYQSELSDPDIIVRTSGEHRLSGFQMWESSYSELLFLQKFWPDFEKADVDLILKEYANRKRRLGGG